MPPHRCPGVSGQKTTGFASVPLTCSVPSTRISAAEPFVAVPVKIFTMLPSPTVSVTPAFTVSVPVTCMREFGGHTVFAAMVPVTVVKAGAASKVIARLATKEFTLAAMSIVPATIAAGICTEPQPRRSGVVVCGKPPNFTTPLSHTLSSAPSRSITANGTGTPTGHAEGAATFSVFPMKADGASGTLRNGVYVGIPSSVPPRVES